MGFDQLAPKWRTCGRCGRMVNCTSNHGVRNVEKGSYRVVTAYERARHRYGQYIRCDAHELACAKKAHVPVEWV